MTALPDLTADCASCAALCCIAFAFDAGEDFAIDKPAGLPCPHLRGHACALHDDLPGAGFPGCAAYDCAGAGQRAVALHGGDSWRDRPEITAPLIETFRHLRRIHDTLSLLVTARRLPLEAPEQAELDALLAGLAPAQMDAARAEAIATGPLPARARAFLRGLAHHV